MEYVSENLKKGGLVIRHEWKNQNSVASCGQLQNARTNTCVILLLVTAIKVPSHLLLLEPMNLHDPLYDLVAIAQSLFHVSRVYEESFTPYSKQLVPLFEHHG